MALMLRHRVGAALGGGVAGGAGEGGPGDLSGRVPISRLRRGEPGLTPSVTTAVRATIAINRSFHLNNEWLHLSRTKQLLLRSLVELGFPDRVNLRDCLWRSTRQVNGLIFAAQVLSQLAGLKLGRSSSRFLCTARRDRMRHWRCPVPQDSPRINICQCLLRGPSGSS
jgi:hypothetical protein